MRKLEIIKRIYKEDNEKIKEVSNNTISTIMHCMMKEMVFTKEYIEEKTGISLSVLTKNINKLVELGFLVEMLKGHKKRYKYKRIYELFVGINMYE